MIGVINDILTYIGLGCVVCTVLFVIIGLKNTRR